MSSLTTKKIIIALQKLGEFMANPNPNFNLLIQNAAHHNAWFTPENVKNALTSLSKMLVTSDLEPWLNNITLSKNPKKVGLVLAGNIPLVGFHDVLCVLATGNIALIKMSSADDKLLPSLLAQLILFEPAFEKHLIYTDRLKDFNAIIATGSNNSARYFEYYFSKVPHIIRKNRNSVAVLNGKESAAEIALLGNDIFDYFGLGCRNVSKIYLPLAYNISNFFEPLESFKPIANHFKYNNNYDYNKSIYLVNRAEHFDNGFLLLREETQFSSPLAVLYYEKYGDITAVENTLNLQKEKIQCVVSNINLKINGKIASFGQSQSPKIYDYADEVNTVDFLTSLAN